MALFGSKLTKRLDLPGQPGLWVEIRTALTVGMKQRTLSAAMTLRMADDGNATFDAFAYRQALLHEIVVGWADPAPVTPAAIDDLDPEVADFLLDQFDALSAPRTEEETAPLGESSSSGPAPHPLGRPAEDSLKSSDISPSFSGSRTEASSLT